MNLETATHVAHIVRTWAQAAFWITGAVLCVIAGYRFLFS